MEGKLTEQPSLEGSFARFAMLCGFCVFFLVLYSLVATQKQTRRRVSGTLPGHEAIDEYLREGVHLEAIVSEAQEMVNNALGVRQ